MIKLRLKFTVDIEVHNIFMVHKPSLSIKKNQKKPPHTQTVGSTPKHKRKHKIL